MFEIVVYYYNRVSMFLAYGLSLYYSILCVLKPDSNLKIIPTLKKILDYFKLLLKINILTIYFPGYLILAFNFYNKNYY